MSTENYYKDKVYKIGGYRKTVILGCITKPGAQVLDIGCGDGELGMLIKEKTKGIVHGVEVSPASVKEAQSKIDTVFCFDIEKADAWPSELFSENYNYIVISEVLEHLFDQEAVLGMVKKLVRPETEIIITVPNLLFWKNRLQILLGNFEYTTSGLMDRGHIHIFSWKSFAHMLQSCGFEIVEQKNNIPTRGTQFLGKYFPGLFAYQFVVKVKSV